MYKEISVYANIYTYIHIYILKQIIRVYIYIYIYYMDVATSGWRPPNRERGARHAHAFLYGGNKGFLWCNLLRTFRWRRRSGFAWLYTSVCAKPVLSTYVETYVHVDTYMHTNKHIWLHIRERGHVWVQFTCMLMRCVTGSGHQAHAMWRAPRGPFAGPFSRQFECLSNSIEPDITACHRFLRERNMCAWRAPRSRIQG